MKNMEEHFSKAEVAGGIIRALRGWKAYGGGGIYEGSGALAYYAKVGAEKAKKILAQHGFTFRLPRAGYEVGLVDGVRLINKSGKYEFDISARVYERAKGGSSLADEVRSLLR